MAATPYDSLIGTAARRYGLEPALVKAVIQCESNFDAEALSSQGAEGLMQLMPATQATLGVSDAFDPSQNIDAGVRYLAILRQTFGTSTPLLLAAYNTGPQAVIAAGYNVPALAATQRYVDCVEAASNAMKHSISIAYLLTLALPQPLAMSRPHPCSPLCRCRPLEAAWASASCCTSTPGISVRTPCMG
jgi:soluble lytic murein transglycosylase-like protein